MSTRRAHAMSAEDQAFTTYLIKELRYFDVAGRWLTSLEKSGRLDQRDQAEIASFRIDILQMQGKKAEAESALAELKRKFPSHQRASLGNLDLIGNALGDLLAQLDRAATAPDRARADQLRSQAARAFQEKVAGPADALIADLGEKASRLKPEDKAYGQAIQSRDQAELSRIKAYLVYAKKLPDGSPERKGLLEKGLSFAERFTEDRGDYPVMLYEAQLQRGNFALELGQLDAALEHFEILYTITPPFEPPYAKPLVDAIKGIRLQALLYGARCAIQAGQAEKARSAIESAFLRPSKDGFDISGAESDPNLSKYGVLVRLEYGVALATLGRVAEGLEQIQGVIRKYKDDATPQAQAFVIDARKAFGRVTTLGRVQLRAQDYYEAALGLKSELRLDEALEAFQTALSSLDVRNVKERRALAPALLNEIGEIHYMQGRPAEAALAYGEIVTYFSDAEKDLVSKVAQNFLASVSKAIDASQRGASHTALAQLREQAAAFYDRRGEGLGGLQSLMVEARKLEEQKKYEEARRKYLEIPRELKKQKVPFYWRAQAQAWTTVLHRWEEATPEARKALEPEIGQLVEALTKIASEATAEEDKTGAATASLTLGQLHYQRQEWPAAVQALKEFGGELATEQFFRCPGLGYLILSLVRTGDCAAARQHFGALQAGCAEEPVVGIAALQIADCLEASGDLAGAAELTLIHAKHPSAKAELEKLEGLMETARRLIDGGKVSEAGEFIERAKKLGKSGGDEDLERQLLILDAKTLINANKLDEGIEQYRAYTKRFGADGKHYEDPFVWQSLGEALSKQSKNGSDLKSLQEAERAYSAACALIRQRHQAVPSDAKLAHLFWGWMLRYLTIKKTLGDKGDPAHYGDVVLFVEDQKNTDMGGFKEEFLKLSQQADARLRAAKGKNP